MYGRNISCPEKVIIKNPQNIRKKCKKITMKQVNWKRSKKKIWIGEWYKNSDVYIRIIRRRSSFLHRSTARQIPTSTDRSLPPKALPDDNDKQPAERGGHLGQVPGERVLRPAVDRRHEEGIHHGRRECLFRLPDSSRRRSNSSIPGKKRTQKLSKQIGHMATAFTYPFKP